MKTIGIIQARMGSTRLPNKMMLCLHSYPIIEWVVSRVLKSGLDDAVVAIPNTKDNDVLEKFLKKFDIRVFRGEQDNVLKRFYDAVRFLDPTHIVRICADNPLIDPVEIDNLLDFYAKNSCDYAYNHIPKNNLYPDGLGAEILSFDLFSWIYESVIFQKHKEHCLSYIWDNCDKIEIKTFDPKEDFLKRPDLKFDIDTFDDYYKLSMRDFDIDISSKEIIKIFGE
ncbi:MULTISPECIES: cytidylyltransferase domain-containing protein [unclassified Campylobacter]|uniref:cytidylyltransferase domain-containing protein n=1 Tax=unclassified Campylobacter TaxID=2593542 RepID=UPI003D338E27